MWYVKNNIVTLALCVVAVIALLAQEGCSGSHESSYDHFSKARQYYEHGNSSAAVIELKNALQLDPKNGDARFLLAKIENEKGNGAAAEVELRKAMELGVNADKVNAALGEAFLLQQKYRKVLNEIKAVNGLTGEMAAAIATVRGNAYLGLGKLVEAGASFASALKQDPNYADAYLGMARLAMERNDQKEALRQIDIALAKSPKEGRAWSMKGDLLRMRNKGKEAREAYEHVLKIDEKNVPARLSLALMDIMGGKLDAARNEIKASRAIAPKYFRIQYVNALLYFREGKYDKARDALQEMEKTAPNYMPGVLLSGAVSYQIGSYEIAHQYLARFLAQFPDNDYAANLLVATDLQLKDPSEALKSLDQLMERNPENPKLLAMAGEAYMQTKDYSKATAYLAKAAAITPKDATLRTQLGVSYLASGKTELAIKDLEDAAALDPGQVKAHALLVAMHLRKGEYDKALQVLKDWKKEQPDNPVIYSLEGSVFAAKNDLAKARLSFKKALQKQPNYFPAALSLAQLDIKDGKPDAARKRLDDFLAADKKSVPAMIALGELAIRAGDDDKAVGWFNKAIQAHPAAIRLRRILISYYVGKKEFKKALSAARDARDANPNDPNTLSFLADIQLLVGDKRSAIENYKRLAKELPKSPVPLFKLAQAQIADQDVIAARDSLRKALQLKPDFIEAELKLVSLDMKDGRYPDALRTAKRIQGQFPRNPIGEALEGDVLSAKREYASAAEHYKKAFDMKHSGLMAVKLHQALTLTGHEKEADDELLRWLKEQPDDLTARMYLADFYLKMGNNKGAIVQYEYVLKKQPNNLMALNNLAWSYQTQGDPRAVTIAERAYKVKPDNAGVMDTLGWILLNGGGEVQRAVDLLRKASSAAPQQPQIRYHYAVALAKSGDTAAAKNELARAIDAGKDFPGRDAAKSLLNKL